MHARQGPEGPLWEARKREPLPWPQLSRRLQVPITQDPEELYKLALIGQG